MMFILDHLDEDTETVMLLGRNNSDINFLKDSLLFNIVKVDGEIKIRSTLYKNLDITYMTAHRSKGAEADTVIVINNKNDTTGFPNLMTDDSVISYVVSAEDDFLYSEERRLFYVALTRTKGRCYLMCPDENSVFTEELKKMEGVFLMNLTSQKEKISCPECQTGYMVKRKNSRNNKFFYSCSNYPQCTLTVNSTSVVESNVRCNKCGGFMALRKGPYGEFYGCTNYPTCEGTYNIADMKK